MCRMISKPTETTRTLAVTSIVTVIFDDAILTLYNPARLHRSASWSVLTLPFQFSIKPPKPETNDGRKHGDDAAQHDECDEPQNDRDPDYQGTDQNDKDICNRVSGRKTAITRRIFQVLFLKPAYSTGFLL